ncbi:MAG: hypothetical protein ABIG93_05490 [archaeon]
MQYKEIHIWEFPATKVFVRVKSNTRKRIISQFIDLSGNEPNAVSILNKKSKIYEMRKSYSRGTLYSWIKGNKGTDCTTCNIPLWSLIEISKLISNEPKDDNVIMRQIEENIEYYSSVGTNKRIYDPQLPILITPELVSLIFHFMGDGHISLKPSVASSYRQINEKGLMNFYLKLQNCFGFFPISNATIKEGKIDVPKSITHILVNYFNIDKSDWHNARIPPEVINMPKEFLLAGLLAFIVDEGNVAEVIEIYSKNYCLLKDVKSVSLRCGYKCKKIRKKFRYNIFDSYRFSISSESHSQLDYDMKKLQSEFPTCSLVHKNNNLEILVKRKSRGWSKKEKGITKNQILNICSKSKSTQEIVEILNIGNSSVREHLYCLEKEGKMCRDGQNGRNILWKTVK